MNHIFPKRLTRLILEWMAQICKYIQFKGSKGCHHNRRMTLWSLKTSKWNTQIYVDGNYILNTSGSLLVYKDKRLECDIYKASSLYTWLIATPSMLKFGFDPNRYGLVLRPKFILLIWIIEVGCFILLLCPIHIQGHLYKQEK